MSTDPYQVAIDQIAKNYQTTEPYYLSNFFQPNGSQHLYDFLQRIYQPQYQDNFRIVIVQNCADQYDYDDMPGLSISTLQKYLSQIDISNFFVVVISANPEIEKELTEVNRLYSTDSVTIRSCLVQAPYHKTLSESQDTFCVLPWMHLYVGPDSMVLPCCQADKNFPMGSVNQQSIAEIFNSSGYKKLRKNMLNGQKSKECSLCYELERSGLGSQRQVHNDRWRSKKLDLRPDGSINEFKPSFLDIRLNNICNLRCRSCSGYFSSAIAQEQAVLFGDKQALSSTMPKQQKAQALANIIDFLPDAEKIYFAGGEPMLTPEHYEILNRLIAIGNTDLELIYNTNFTVLSYKDQSVTQLWQHFSNVTVLASLDAIGPVAEYVRHGTVWSDIQSNLHKVKTQCPHVNLEVYSTVSLLNVTSLIQLQKTWHTENLLDLNKFSLLAMVSPKHLSLCVLPEHHKQRLTQAIEQHADWCRQQNAHSVADHWLDAAAYMRSQNWSHFLPEFKRLTNTLDQFRNQSLISVLPEYADLLH